MKTLRPRLAPARPRGWNRTRGSRQDRGYGAEWERVRKQALERDHGLCVYCLARGHTTPASAVDHFIPKSQGGSDALENLKSTCDPCHTAKTQRESRGEGAGEISATSIAKDRLGSHPAKNSSLKS